MIPVALLPSVVSIKRRSSTGTDSLNNPVYGAPTSGAGWKTIYNNIQVRLAFSSKAINFAQTGERITPNGVMYYNAGPLLMPEDRVLTSDGIEYVITSIVQGQVSAVVDHYEAILQLP